jgi:predicted nucleotidyltransferase component of viral defense system
MERFLYRLSISPYRNMIILKGGLAISAWNVPQRRFTRDIDLRGYSLNSIPAIIDVVAEICNQQVEPDGMEYLDRTIRGSTIRSNSEYPGVRITFLAELGKMQIPMHIDLDFDDCITPFPVELEYPALLAMPSPHLIAYPLETIIAEKLEAMVSLSEFNSRIKDFYDVWILSKQFDFDGHIVMTAIKNTFEHRKTEIPSELNSLFSIYKTDKFTRFWISFTNKNQSLIKHQITFSAIIDDLVIFLQTPVEALIIPKTPIGFWKAGSGWR